MTTSNNSTGATPGDNTHHMDDLLTAGIISLIIAILGASGISYAFYRSIKQVRLRRHVIAPELLHISRWLSTHGTCSCQHDNTRIQPLNPTAPAINAIYPEVSRLPPPYHSVYFDVIVPETASIGAHGQTTSHS